MRAAVKVEKGKKGKTEVDEGTGTGEEVTEEEAK
jgi:hypothetical protein